MSQELAVRLSKEKINVNTLMLGYVKQERKILREEDFYQTSEKVILSKQTPDPEEIAGLILGILELSNCNRLFSGQTILGDACLSLQAHSSVAELSKSKKSERRSLVKLRASRIGVCQRRGMRDNNNSPSFFL